MFRAHLATSELDTAARLAAVLGGAFDVRVSATAEAALRDIQAPAPDVVVVHHGLLGPAPAAEVAGLLARRAELRGCAVLGFGPLSAAAEFHKAGAHAFEPEPLEPRRLLAHIEALRRRRAGVRELEERLDALERERRDLLAAERVKDDLTHMLVHDLKNPIAAVMGLLDVVIADSRRPAADARRLLGIAREEAQHLLHLTANILDVRRMQEGKLALDSRRLSPADLALVLEQAIGDVGSAAAERRVHRRVPQSLPGFEADPGVLRRVLANLVSNAVKHTGRNGVIEVAARPVPDGLEIIVRDNGEGIPAEDLKRIFDPYGQSRVTVHDRFDTGMGLAFCKLAVERHGGRIWAESVRGAGASFYFSLPLGHPEFEDLVELVD